MNIKKVYGSAVPRQLEDAGLGLMFYRKNIVEVNIEGCRQWEYDEVSFYDFNELDEDILEEVLAIVGDDVATEYRRRSLEAKLESTTEKFVIAMEQFFSSSDFESYSGSMVDEHIDIKSIADERIAIRRQIDNLGKVVQTAEGDGSWENPFKTWTPGTTVTTGEWWMTHDGYLWEAIATGVPQSSLDRDYWDIVG